jgi:hypothetical protein
MEAAAHEHRHAMPTSGRALTGVALSATPALPDRLRDRRGRRRRDRHGARLVGPGHDRAGDRARLPLRLLAAVFGTVVLVAEAFQG